MALWFASGIGSKAAQALAFSFICVFQRRATAAIGP
jgi:hypothetical protein